MNSRLRQDAILRQLRRLGSATVATLAQDAGVSRRTVLRDIAALRDQGYLIHSDFGRGGGLWLDPGAVQGSARIQASEIFALILGVAAMRAARALPFADLADAGLARIERTLPADRVRDLRRLLDCLHVGQPTPAQTLCDLGPMDAALLPAFEEAFLGRRPLGFDYHDARHVRSRREVEPQALLVLPPLWYLVAWDPARSDFRHFRMDRISRPRIIPGPQFRRRRFDFGAYVCPLHDLPGPRR